MRKTNIRRFGALIAGLGLVVAACGGGDDAATDTTTMDAVVTTEAPAVSGDPVKVMTITDLNSSGPVYPNIKFTAEAFQEWANANDGIKGRPIEVEVCDSVGTPEGSAACARKAVDSGVVAVIGSFNFAPDSIIQILEPAGIAYFGACCPLGAAEFQSQIVFTLGSHQAYGIAFAKKTAEDGCKNVNAVVIQGAESFIDIIKIAAEKVGVTINRTTVLPSKSQDFAPQVAEATKGDPDCLMMIVSETPYIAWMPAFAASGSTARMYGPQGNLNMKACAGFLDICEGDVVVGAYPDLSLPVWDNYRAALAAINAPTTEDYNSLGGLGTWVAYEGFKQVAEKIPAAADINAASFLKMAATATVDLPGKIPTVDFTKEWKCGVISGYFTRLFNRSVVYSQFKDGKLVPTSTAFEDVSYLVETPDCK